MSAPAVAIDRSQTLRVNEIFLSIQGESSKVGLPTSFIRLTGCPLRCAYCDTAYAFHAGERLSIAAIMQAIKEHDTPHVTVTGGEPLAQKHCLSLLAQLCEQGYQVSLETSGAVDVSAVDARVIKVLDIKTPGSGEDKKNRLANLQHLSAQDQIKFVLCDRADYEWARALVQAQQLQQYEVLFSPSHEQMQAAELAEWILKDRLPVRLQVQLHKYLWGDRRGV